KMAAECVEEGKNTSAITIFNELEGFWRVAGEKEKSYAAAEAALGLISSGEMEGSIGHATTLLNYATAKTAFGEAKEALELYDQVEKIYDWQLPEDDYRYAGLYNNMAQSLLRVNDVKTAGEYFSKSLALLEKMQNVQSETATCHSNLAICLMAQKKLDEAGENLKKSEELFASLPGDPHADSMLATRGQLEYMLGNYAEAAEYYKRAASNIEKRFGRNPYYVRACRNCAKALEAAGNTEEAERWQQLSDSAGERR
ncbi:MAG: tetratricopeptide repeat protein, partial [Synergistaceae bacterium]|nr:tetratricopeptide repeat protein [Synergistaceae bacterium]